MNQKQIDLVQQSFAKVLPISEAAAGLFYLRLFQLDPSLEGMFKGDMKQQGRMLMSMINTAVKGLSNLGQIVPPVQALGRRHAGYGVRKEHYATVGEALLWTLERGLGAEFTPETREAWTAAYGLLAGVMQQAADEVALAA